MVFLDYLHKNSMFVIFMFFAVVKELKHVLFFWLLSFTVIGDLTDTFTAS